MIVYSMTTDVTDLAVVRVGRVREIATAHLGLRGPLIPILHAVQRDLGHIDQADVPVIADVLNLSAAEVHGVVTFYRDFRRAPGGRATVRICLGNCALGPAVQVDGRLHGRVSPARLDALLGEVAR
jgi:formate dehydrogenase subunit gamma